MKKIVNIKNREETKVLGEKLGSLCFENSVITLTGDLGAGKTTFTQGIAKGLGISKTVSSPTFTILKIYQGRLPLYHFDAYRLEGLNQDLGFEEMIDGDGVAIVEWPEYIRRELPDECLNIIIHNGEDEEREFIFEACGEVYEKLLEELV